MQEKLIRDREAKHRKGKGKQGYDLRRSSLKRRTSLTWQGNWVTSFASVYPNCRQESWAFIGFTSQPLARGFPEEARPPRHFLLSVLVPKVTSADLVQTSKERCRCGQLQAKAYRSQRRVA